MKKLIAMLVMLLLVGGTAWAGGSAKTNNFRYQVHAYQTFTTNAEGLSVPNYKLNETGGRIAAPVCVYHRNKLGFLAADAPTGFQWAEPDVAHYCFDNRYPANDYPL